MELWTAFLLGFLGSLHCIGMCGPIALALPGGFKSRPALLVSRLLYNIGRIISYSILGVVAGLLGSVIAAAGFQQVLSIVAGVLILLMVLVPSLASRAAVKIGFIDRATTRIKQVWGRLFGKRGQTALFAIGFLNGFLPCGLVYVAMAAAAPAGTISGSVIYMAMFGLGTLPVMFVTAMSGQLLGVRFRQAINRLIPIGACVLALLLILRGMSLGIPYVSPKIDKHAEKVECCH